MNNNDKLIYLKTTIPNEFSPSLINYHIEQHSKPSPNLIQIPIVNQAELYAIQEEQKRQAEEQRKKQAYQKNIQKCKENITKYNETHKDECENFHQSQKKFRYQMKEKTKEYNESLRQNILQKQKRKSTATTQCSNANNSNNNQQSCIEDTNNSKDQMQQSKILDTFSFQNINDEEQKSQLQDFNMQSNESNRSIARNIRDDLEYQLLDQHLNFQGNGNIHSIYQNTSKEDDMRNIHDKINSNIQMVKNFRKTGLMMMTGGNNQTESSFGMGINAKKINESMNTENQTMQSQNSNKNNNSTNHVNDLQQRRYQKALKKLMIEQLQNKSINIPSICSCGQLQRKIDSLILGQKTITPNDLMNADCANNCIYYQRPSEYHRALTDIIQSIRTLKIDNK